MTMMIPGRLPNEEEYKRECEDYSIPFDTIRYPESMREFAIYNKRFFDQFHKYIQYETYAEHKKLVQYSKESENTTDLSNKSRDELLNELKHIHKEICGEKGTIITEDIDTPKTRYQEYIRAKMCHDGASLMCGLWFCLTPPDEFLEEYYEEFDEDD